MLLLLFLPPPSLSFSFFLSSLLLFPLQFWSQKTQRLWSSGGRICGDFSCADWGSNCQILAELEVRWARWTIGDLAHMLILSGEWIEFPQQSTATKSSSPHSFGSPQGNSSLALSSESQWIFLMMGCACRWVAPPSQQPPPPPSTTA